MSSPTNGDYGVDSELAKLRELGERVFNLRFDDVTQSGSRGNTLGIRTGNTLFSRRLDSRTYFVQDDRFGLGREAGVFDGPEHELLAVCRSVLAYMGIPPEEIGEERVVKEYTQDAEWEPDSGTATMGSVEKGNQYAQVGRRVAGYPVWHSGCLLGLTRDKQIGLLQLHWPDLPPLAVDEVQALGRRVDSEWEPPECPGAHVESMEAGITHSMPVSFVMDIYPAIRVIYAPDRPNIGRKPVRYLDRHGEEVPTPRNYAEQETPRTSSRRPPSTE